MWLGVQYTDEPLPADMRAPVVSIIGGDLCRSMEDLSDRIFTVHLLRLLGTCVFEGFCFLAAFL